MYTSIYVYCTFVCFSLSLSLSLSPTDRTIGPIGIASAPGTVRFRGHAALEEHLGALRAGAARAHGAKAPNFFEQHFRSLGDTERVQVQ